MGVRLGRWRSKRRLRAFSLVELLVAMTLGLLLTAAAASLFLSVWHLYQEQERVAAMKENLRFVTDFMTRDIRGAGLGEDGSVDWVTGLQPANPDVGVQERFVVRKSGMNCLGETGPWVVSVYRVDHGQLYCGNEANPPQNQPLLGQVRMMTAVPLNAADEPDWERPVALRIELLLESRRGNEVLVHAIEFVIGLRNAILDHYHAI